MTDLRSIADQIIEAAHEATLRHEDPVIQTEDIRMSIIDVLEEAFKAWESDRVAELEEELSTYKRIEESYDYNAA